MSPPLPTQWNMQKKERGKGEERKNDTCPSPNRDNQNKTKSSTIVHSTCWNTVQQHAPYLTWLAIIQTTSVPQGTGNENPSTLDFSTTRRNIFQSNATRGKNLRQRRPPMLSILSHCNPRTRLGKQFSHRDRHRRYCSYERCRCRCCYRMATVTGRPEDWSSSLATAAAASTTNQEMPRPLESCPSPEGGW